MLIPYLDIRGVRLIGVQASTSKIVLTIQSLTHSHVAITFTTGRGSAVGNWCGQFIGASVILFYSSIRFAHTSSFMLLRYFTIMKKICPLVHTPTVLLQPFGCFISFLFFSFLSIFGGQFCDVARVTIIPKKL